MHQPYINSSLHLGISMTSNCLSDYGVHHDREGGSIEGVGRIFQRVVEPGRKQRRAGATVLCSLVENVID